MGDVRTLSERGKLEWKDEQRVTNYLRLNNRLVNGVPGNDPLAYRRSALRNFIGSATPPPVQLQNSVVLMWATDPNFAYYQIMRRRSDTLFRTRGYTTGGSYTEQTLPDNATGTYRIYGMTASGVGTLLAEVTATQGDRDWSRGNLVITRPGTYSGNYQSLDPNVPAIQVAPGVTGWTLTNFRVRGRGHLIDLGEGSKGVIRNGIGWGMHPGKAGVTVGDFVRGVKIKGILCEYVDFENVRHGMLIDGKAIAGNTEQAIFRKWRGFNINTAYTTNTGYQPVRGYTGHIFNADQLWACPEYDVEDGENVQEYLQGSVLGMVEDGINNFISSGIPSRRGNIRRLCLWGMYPFDGRSDPRQAVGYNYGCGIISDGVYTPDNNMHGWMLITQNLLLGCGNAGLGVDNGNDQEWSFNRVITSGFLPSNEINRGTNVGVQVGTYSGGVLRRNNVHDNGSMCFDRQGSNNKPNASDYPFNNGFDFPNIGKDGNVQSNNALIGPAHDPYDPYDPFSSLAQEGIEHAAWHLARYQGSSPLGALTY